MTHVTISILLQLQPKKNALLQHWPVTVNNPLKAKYLLNHCTLDGQQGLEFPPLRVQFSLMLLVAIATKRVMSVCDGQGLQPWQQHRLGSELCWVAWSRKQKARAQQGWTNGRATLKLLRWLNGAEQLQPLCHPRNPLLPNPLPNWWTRLSALPTAPCPQYLRMASWAATLAPELRRTRCGHPVCTTCSRN